MKADKELAKWCAVLSQSGLPCDEVPDGWNTIAELAEACGKDRSTVTHRVTKLIQEGKAEKRAFKILTGRGVYPVPHYKLL